MNHETAVIGAVCHATLRIKIVQGMCPQVLDTPAPPHQADVTQSLVCERARQTSEERWEALFEVRFGHPSRLQHAAHKLAGSWLSLFKAKTVTNKV